MSALLGLLVHVLSFTDQCAWCTEDEQAQSRAYTRSAAREQTTRLIPSSTAKLMHRQIKTRVDAMVDLH